MVRMCCPCYGNCHYYVLWRMTLLPQSIPSGTKWTLVYIRHSKQCHIKGFVDQTLLAALHNNTIIVLKTDKREKEQVKGHEHDLYIIKM